MFFVGFVLGVIVAFPIVYTTARLHATEAMMEEILELREERDQILKNQRRKGVK